MISKALVKRNRKSTRVNASLQNQNLCTDLRKVAKRIRKSQKAVNFMMNLWATAVCLQAV